MAQRLFQLVVLLGLAALTVQTNARSEELHLGLSQETIFITSNFNGTAIFVFGSVEGGDAATLAQQGYDVIVVLEGPDTPANLRQKERIFGIWVNTKGRLVEGTPGSYSLATTRELDKIANDVTFRGLGIGKERLELNISDDPDAQFSEAFLRLKEAGGLYLQNEGDVRFLSPALFRARVEIPANVPIGEHVVKGYLFKDGALLSTSSTPMRVQKAGFEAFVYNAAHKHSFIYGLAVVFLAIFAGWLASVIFRKK